MPRFVLLRHECPPEFGKSSHWDLMLEQGSSLRTWQLEQLPLRWAEALGEPAERSCVVAIPLSDHRLEYLEYEGPLSDNRGNVRRCDSGTYDTLDRSEKRWTFKLSGRHFSGAALLERHKDNWLLTET